MKKRTDLGPFRLLQYLVGLVAGIIVMLGTTVSGAENPELCLNVVGCDAPARAVGACTFTQGQSIDVTVDMGFSTLPICAAQFFLQYDTNVLLFTGITPGGGVFNTGWGEAFDSSAGTIDYLVGENPGAICTGTNGPATLATISFIALDDCENQGVDFRSHDPPTRLGAVSGAEVCPAGHFGPDGHCGTLIDPCGTGALSIESNGILDLLDYVAFQSCVAGGRTQCCEVFDSNNDGSLNLLDWADFQVAFGAGK